MIRAHNKQGFFYCRDGSAPRKPHVARPVALPPSIILSDLHPFILLMVLLLAFLLSQGCAAMGVALLGGAATTATKAGVSYTLDSKAQKTFTAPVSQVKSSLLAALGEMAFPIASAEKNHDGERIVARVDGREVEVELEPVTPKATKIMVVVHQGWFWKDRATAEEIIDQTGRGVETVVQASRGGGAGGPSGARKTSADGQPAPTAVLLDPWDPQRWREGFAPAPPPAARKVETHPARSEPAALPAPPVPRPALVMARGPASPPEAGGRLPVQPPPLAAAPANADARPTAGPDSDGSDVRWRVIRRLRVRQCPGAACGWGPTLKKGDVVIRLRERDQWWRVWLAGTAVIGWVPASDLAPQRWWDPPVRPLAVSLR